MGQGRGAAPSPPAPLLPGFSTADSGAHPGGSGGGSCPGSPRTPPGPSPLRRARGSVRILL